VDNPCSLPCCRIGTFELFLPNAYHKYRPVFNSTIDIGRRSAWLLGLQNIHEYLHILPVFAVCNSGFKAVLWLRQLVAARTGSQSNPCGICGQQSWHWDRFSSEYFGFLPSLSFHQCSVLIFFHVLRLQQWQTTEAWKPSKTRGHSIKKNYFKFFFDLQ